MKLEQLEGNWDQIKGQVTTKWRELTDGDISLIDGKKDQLIGKIRERYGYGEKEAERQFNAFVKGCRCESDDKKSSTPVPHSNI